MCTARAEALDFGRPRPRRRGRPAFYRGRPPDAGLERTGSVGGSSNRLLRDRNGRLAYADGGDDGGEQAKNGEGVEPTAKAAGDIFEPADDRGAGAAAQNADRVDPGDANWLSCSRTARLNAGYSRRLRNRPRRKRFLPLTPQVVHPEKSLSSDALLAVSQLCMMRSKRSGRSFSR